MKRIYFVRHGESESNAGGLRLGAETPLTSKGYEQAAFIAERCAKLPIDVLVSSTMIRARETARFISEKINKVPEFSDLFVERKYCSEFLGKRQADEETLRVEQIIEEKFVEPNYRYSDEENFEDLYTRAQQAIQFLETRKEENILVVTHGFFLHVLIGHVIFGPKFTAQECNRLLRTLKTSNTGVTVFIFDESKEGKPEPWYVLTWNDHAHLAD